MSTPADVLAHRAAWSVACCDALAGLASLPDESVSCCITSPPYFSLRDYGTATWEGGDPACGHVAVDRPRNDTTNSSTGSSYTGTRGTQPAKEYRQQYRGVCARCGAVRVDQQIGLEPDLASYLARLVAVFAEVRRVLRRDGTLWVNCGDSYSGGGGFSPDAPSNRADPSRTERRNGDRSREYAGRQPAAGFKQKDLLGVPWRLAFALQEDGYYLRSAITWCKPHPMPESVTDRPTSATEMVFLFTRSARYAYDAAAIAEPTEPRAAWVPSSDKQGVTGIEAMDSSNGRRYTGFNARWNAAVTDGTAPATRNKRNWWVIPSAGFPDAHFAVMPTALVEPCVLAGCPPDGIVLDPFAGSGTVGVVVLRHGRRFVGLELSATYAAMARDRITNDAPLLNTPPALEPVAPAPAQLDLFSEAAG